MNKISEINIAEKVFSFMQHLINECDFDDSDTEQLYINSETNADIDISYAEIDSEDSSSGEEYSPDDESKSSNFIPLDDMQKVVEFSKKNVLFTPLQNRFKKVKSHKQLSRMKSIVQKEGLQDKK